MAMPVFADALSLMEARYGFQISLSNIHQTRVIDATGKVVATGFDEASVEKALKGVTWKFKDESHDPKLAAAAQLLEAGRYAEGVQKLTPLLKRKDTAEAAQKLLDRVKAEVQGWVGEADGCKGSDPARAYDLYARAAAAFKSEDIGKTATAAAKKLSSDKAVKAELAARKQFAQLHAALSKATPEQKGEVERFCQDIAKKHPGTSTAEKAKSLAEELGAPAPQ